MDPLDLRDHLLAYPCVSEEEPFGPGTVVYKVSGKMFALTSYERLPLSINLKCDPEKAVELRGDYAAIEAGYPMNKNPWNPLPLDGSIPKQLTLELIRHSYDLVIASLPRKKREELQNLTPQAMSLRKKARDEFLNEI